MNALIIYYSLTGTTENFAKELKDITCIDMLKIETKSSFQYKGPLKFLIGSFQSITGYNPSIKKIDINLDEYDTFIIMSPVWADHIASPFYSFFKKYHFKKKKIILVANCAQSKGKIFIDFKKYLKNNLILNEYILYNEKNKENKLILNKIIKYLSNRD